MNEELTLYEAMEVIDSYLSYVSEKAEMYPSDVANLARVGGGAALAYISAKKNKDALKNWKTTAQRLQQVSKLLNDEIAKTNPDKNKINTLTEERNRLKSECKKAIKGAIGVAGGAAIFAKGAGNIVGPEVRRTIAKQRMRKGFADMKRTADKFRDSDDPNLRDISNIIDDMIKNNEKWSKDHGLI